MSDPYVGEIRMFGGNFAPVGWAFCAGQIMPISQNDTLFNLIGTTYGGDGEETFGLPDLQGRAPLHQGQGPGIKVNYVIGEAAGVPSVTLTAQQIPVHNHAFLCSSAAGQNTQPASGVFAALATGKLYTASAGSSTLATNTASIVGGSQPHENMQPYLAISFIISLYGIYPNQS